MDGVAAHFGSAQLAARLPVKAGQDTLALQTGGQPLPVLLEPELHWPGPQTGLCGYHRSRTDRRHAQL